MSQKSVLVRCNCHQTSCVCEGIFLYLVLLVMTLSRLIIGSHCFIFIETWQPPSSYLQNVGTVYSSKCWYLCVLDWCYLRKPCRNHIDSDTAFCWYTLQFIFVICIPLQVLSGWICVVKITYVQLSLPFSVSRLCIGSVLGFTCKNFLLFEVHSGWIALIFF